MRPELAALVVHDLKNALGLLESRLGALVERPEPAAAMEAQRLCADMRSRFVTFLTLYAHDGRMTAHCEDESPRAFLDGLVARIPRPAGAVPLTLGACEFAPACWYFDFRLVRLAIEAALHNAWRFARSAVRLDARAENGWLVLSVDDDGPGLGAADPLADIGGSTGLGTELCRAVARAHADAQSRARTTGEGGEDRDAGGVRLFDRPEGGARFELWLA